MALAIGNSAYQHTSKLINPSNDVSDLARILKTLGYQVFEGIDLKAGMDRSIRQFARALSDADAGVFFYAGPWVEGFRTKFSRVRSTSRLPTIYEWPEYPAEGALMEYGPTQALISRLVAELIDRVLKGVSPAELPVLRATKFELAITARVLGLTIPPALLARAGF